MFTKELAHDETYVKNNNNYDLSSSYTVYEAFIAVSKDKDGNIIKNKDGSPRYHTIEDRDIVTTSEDKVVKKIRDGFYKDVYQVNGDYVEKVERDGKRIYFVVEENRIVTLPAGSQVIARGDTYRSVGEVGYVLVDDFVIEKPKVIAVRPFKTEDHKKEAEDIVKAKTRRFREDEE